MKFYTISIYPNGDTLIKQKDSDSIESLKKELLEENADTKFIDFLRDKKYTEPRYWPENSIMIIKGEICR